MTNTDAPAWVSILPEDILRRAYHSENELAWNRSDALRVATILQDRGYRIIGVDTWLPTRPGPTPLIEDWYESHALSALDFIKTFEPNKAYGGHDGMIVYFNFCV